MPTTSSTTYPRHSAVRRRVDSNDRHHAQLWGHRVGATGGQDLPGDSPLAILIHGAAMDRSVWSLQTRWLAHHDIAALAIDLPGHGGSTEPERTSIADYADWLAGIVEPLDQPVHLVGHSMGSFIALETCARTACDSLTMIGTAAGMPTHPALLEAAENNDPLAAQLMSGWAFAPSVRTGPHPSPGASMVGSTQAMIGQAASGVLYHDLKMCADYADAAETAAACTTPTTLLLGQLDRMTPVRAAQPLIEAFAEPTTEIIPGVGHMIQIEAPEATRTAIASAVASTPVA